MMDRVTWSLPGIELLALNWSLIGWIESKVITSVIDVVGENHMTTDSMSIGQAVYFSYAWDMRYVLEHGLF